VSILSGEDQSTEIRQELKIVPAQASVVKHVRYTTPAAAATEKLLLVWFLTCKLLLCHFVFILPDYPKL